MTYFPKILLCKIRRKSEKNLIEWFWLVLPRVGFTDSHEILKPASDIGLGNICIVIIC